MPTAARLKKRAARHAARGVCSDGYNSEYRSAEYHQNQVEYPHDGESEYKSDKTGYDLSLHESRHEAEYPRGDGDYRKDNAHQAAETEVIAFSCHGELYY